MTAATKRWALGRAHGFSKAGRIGLWYRVSMCRWWALALGLVACSGPQDPGGGPGDGGPGPSDGSTRRDLGPLPDLGVPGRTDTGEGPPQVLALRPSQPAVALAVQEQVVVDFDAVFESGGAIRVDARALELRVDDPQVVQLRPENTDLTLVGLDFGVTTVEAEFRGQTGRIDLTVGHPVGVVFEDRLSPVVDADAQPVVEPDAGRGGSPTLAFETDPATTATVSFTSRVRQDLSGFQALELWTQSPEGPAVLSVGLGRPVDGVPWVTRRSVRTSTSWQRVIVPIPLPPRVRAEDRLFRIAVAAPSRTTVFVDDVKYTLSTEGIGTKRARLPAPEQQVRVRVGDRFSLPGRLRFGPSSADFEAFSGAYFDFTSDDPRIVSGGPGLLRAEAPGTAQIGATLSTVDADGTVPVLVEP